MISESTGSNHVCHIKLPNIIRLIKPQRIRWAGHVARLTKTNSYRGLDVKPKGKIVNVHLPSLMMKVPNHLYVLGDTYTCHTYCCYAYHFYAY
jgi:hypothetical protein